MKSELNPANELSAIRVMMERSSKFLSLSGLSGIFAGCTALIGAAAAYWLVLKPNKGELTQAGQVDLAPGAVCLLMLIGLIVLTVALAGSIYFSVRKARKKHLQIWNKASRQLLIHLFIPLAAGGLFSLVLIGRHDIELVAASTLIFYGLALVNAGKFTFGEIHYLGLCEIVVGLLAGVFPHFGLWFWVTGFGGLHIVYGLAMYLKYER